MVMAVECIRVIVNGQRASVAFWSGHHGQFARLCGRPGGEAAGCGAVHLGQIISPRSRRRVAWPPTVDESCEIFTTRMSVGRAGPQSCLEGCTQSSGTWLTPYVGDNLVENLGDRGTGEGRGGRSTRKIERSDTGRLPLRQTFRLEVEILHFLKMRFEKKQQKLENQRNFSMLW